LKYIYQNNQGVAVARNTGIKEAIGEFITFLDADDILLPHALQSLSSYLEVNCHEGMVYGNSEIFDNTTNKILGYNHPLDGQEVPATRPNRTPYTGRCADKFFLHGNFVPICSTMIRRKIFDELGCFDHRFLVGEDMDMYIRISSKYPIGYMKQVMARRRRHPESLVYNDMKGAKARVLITRKCLINIPGLRASVGEQAINKRIYIDYYRLGMTLILNGQPLRGRRWLIKAWQLDKNIFNNKIALYYMLSMLPSLAALKSLRQKWHLVRRKLLKRLA